MPLSACKELVVAERVRADEATQRCSPATMSQPSIESAVRERPCIQCCVCIPRYSVPCASTCDDLQRAAGATAAAPKIHLARRKLLHGNHAAHELLRTLSMHLSSMGVSSEIRRRLDRPSRVSLGSTCRVDVVTRPSRLPSALTIMSRIHAQEQKGEPF